MVDKLSIKPGDAVAFAGDLDNGLRERVLAQAGRPAAEADERLDVVLVAVDDGTDAVATLARWKARLEPAGGVWLLTPKRGRLGYVDQRDLIAVELATGLVDNRGCSVADVTSAMRFVIRKADRPPGG